ncbi:hypothetical protein P7K49_003808 [Saguinus oedipus]|uniref:PDZ domain-containing protein n=1 Tax=Saguinus oedipus TaxID=9490 RepID=A0ABQ9W5K4_SAGOE|nr:hypothetical protein P7K49_003808 [Saguinus oedipus]
MQGRHSGLLVTWLAGVLWCEEVKPCHIQAVDPSGPAAAAGMKVCQFVVSVNGLNVLHVDYRTVSNQSDPDRPKDNCHGSHGGVKSAELLGLPALQR